MTAMTPDLASLAQYQQAFSAYLRDPSQQARPANTSARGMQVYQEIVFNNVFNVISACFPVAQKVMGKRAWLKLLRGFLRDHSANTPLFHQIPLEFLSYLSSATLADANLPPYLSSLCHYEWIELKVAIMPDLEAGSQFAQQKICRASDLLNYQPVLNASLQLLSYPYAVHKISARHKPKSPQASYLAVFRDATGQVQFIELNGLSHDLLTMLTSHNMTGKEAIKLMAERLNHLSADAVQQFGGELLQRLAQQGLIVGVYRDKPAS